MPENDQQDYESNPETRTLYVNHKVRTSQLWRCGLLVTQPDGIIIDSDVLLSASSRF